jgi:hypothetical protein
MNTNRIIVPDLQYGFKSELAKVRQYHLELAALAMRAVMSSDPREIRLALAVVQRQGETISQLHMGEA